MNDPFFLRGLDAFALRAAMAAKACMLTKYLCDQQMISLDAHISGGYYESDLKRVLRDIEATAEKGLPRCGLLQQQQGIPAKRLSEIIANLIEIFIDLCCYYDNVSENV